MIVSSVRSVANVDRHTSHYLRRIHAATFASCREEREREPSGQPTRTRRTWRHVLGVVANGARFQPNVHGPQFVTTTASPLE